MSNPKSFQNIDELKSFLYENQESQSLEFKQQINHINRKTIGFYTNKLKLCY